MDWGDLAAHALWLGGLALGLAALSVANHRAGAEGAGLGRVLAAPGYRAAALGAAVLVGLGLFWAAAAWWQRGLAAAWTLLWAGWGAAVHGRDLAAAAGRWWRPAAQPGGAPAERRLVGRALLGRGLVGAGLLIVVAWTLVAAIQTVGHARSLQVHAERLAALAEGGPAGLATADLAGLGEQVAGMHHDLEAIDAAVGPLLPLGRLLGWVPVYGGDVAAAADLLALGLHTAAAGDGAFQALSPALDVLEGVRDGSGPDAPLAEQLLPPVAAARPELEVARQELALAGQSRGRIDAGALSPRTAGLVAQVDRYLPWFETAVDGALLAPGLLGADGPRTYLVVAQNNQELRASGGFISGVGELHVEGGRITSLTFRDSYAVDNFEVPHGDAPPGLQATLFGRMWLFRDANWSPDFATSARQMLALYAQDRGVRAEGVIALDLTALELLLEGVGPLEVEGVARVVTGENVQQVLQEQWANPTAGPALGEGGDQAWWEHRKDFLGQVAAALLDRVQTGQELEPGALAGALERALEEKHVLLYLEDAGAAALLRGRNWDGAVLAAASPGDFLLVVDSNVGFNKVDPNVTRSIRYEVDLSTADAPRGRLTLTYGNRSRRPVDVCVQEARYGETYADMMDRCYWDYVRVYVPAGSRLLSGPELSLPAGSLLARSGATEMPAGMGQGSEGQMRVWGAFFDLAPGAERSLEFEYELPADVVRRDAAGLVEYRLGVQKQPGTEAVPLELQVTLPRGVTLVEAVPADLFSAEGNSARAVTDLRTDREFGISFREEMAAP